MVYLIRPYLVEGYSFSHRNVFHSIQEFLEQKAAIQPTQCMIRPVGVLSDKALVVFQKPVVYHQPEERLEEKVARRKRYAAIDARLEDETAAMPIRVTNQGLFKLSHDQLSKLCDGSHLIDAAVVFEPKRDISWLVQYVLQSRKD